ncbi:anti-sigma factor family protein [Nocardia macrotermitis]|uniref:Anti-sigma-L factor RslA n=1 Tax=Nocardia macrotermitis TaxID=2585198 RepID=A0A7K0DDB3_9NOCA|nr:zf-HC2 domain-containing protein [Nocardia macrotermitis]MQY23491.1 Anti-sigma-L factor RslA [Nocardia macrotermitis]
MTDIPRVGEGEAVFPDGDDDYAMWDAPYVLGSLTRAERLRYEAHLEECASCRAAVAEFSGLPGLLGQVDPEVALALIDAPVTPELVVVQPDSQPEVPPPAPRGRARERWLTIGAAVAAAAAAVAIAVPITAALDRHTETPSTEQVVAERQLAPVLPSPVTASYKLVAVPGGGTRIEMTCSYSPSETEYTWQGALWVIHTDGTEAMVAQWTAHPGQTLTPDGTTAVPPDQIRAVQIRDASSNQVILSSSL